MSVFRIRGETCLIIGRHQAEVGEKRLKGLKVKNDKTCLQILRHLTKGGKYFSGIIQFPQNLLNSSPFAALGRTNGYGRKRNFPNPDQLN